jgi:hypothetical protein
MTRAEAVKRLVKDKRRWEVRSAGKGSKGERLIRAAGLRWPVGEDFEFSKDCFGLDQYQARLYTAIAQHVVLVMAALAVCAITAALLRDRTDTQAPPPVRPDQPPPAGPGMIPLTVPEIKRLLAALTTRPLPPWHVIHWHARTAATGPDHDGPTNTPDSPACAHASCVFESKQIPMGEVS